VKRIIINEDTTESTTGLIVFFKNNKRLAVSGVRLDRLSHVKCPEAESICLDGRLVAVMQRYF
jgi:hypothetical protein